MTWRCLKTSAILSFSLVSPRYVVYTRAHRPQTLKNNANYLVYSNIVPYFGPVRPSLNALHPVLPMIRVEKGAEGVVLGRLTGFLTRRLEAVIDHLLQTRRDDFIVQPPALWIPRSLRVIEVVARTSCILSVAIALLALSSHLASRRWIVSPFSPASAALPPLLLLSESSPPPQHELFQ